MSESTNQRASPSVERSIVRRQSLIALATAGLSLLCYLPTSSIAYWRGYYQGTLREVPRGLHWDQFFFVMSGTLWLLAAGFFVAVFVLLFRYRERMSIVRWILLLCAVGSTPLLFFARGPGAVHHVRGFRDGIGQVNIDYAAIRRWRRPQGPASGDLVPQRNWPAAIRRLQPQYVFLQGESATTVMYGSGFGHWGITVYPDPDRPPGQYNVAPGVEAWYSE